MHCKVPCALYSFFPNKRDLDSWDIIMFFAYFHHWIHRHQQPIVCCICLSLSLSFSFSLYLYLSLYIVGSCYFVFLVRQPHLRDPTHTHIHTHIYIYISWPTLSIDSLSTHPYIHPQLFIQRSVQLSHTLVCWPPPWVSKDVLGVLGT